MMSESMSYMDACVYNSESKKVLGPELAGPSSLMSVLKKEKYEAGIHLSYASALSYANKHEDSLKHSKIALKKGLVCMKILHKICIEHLTRHNKLMNTDSIRKRLCKQFQYNLIQSPHYKSYHKLVNQALPFLQYFHNKYHSTSSKSSKLNLKSAVLQFYAENEGFLSGTLDEITELKPLNPAFVSTSLGIYTEISNESFLQKILLIVASMYNIAIELKYSVEDKLKAKIWHKKTIQNAEELLPQHCMILKQLKESYVREYNKLDIYPYKKRQNTVSSRTRTPVPIMIHKPWPHNQSHFESKDVNFSKLFSKHAEGKISPAPRPNSSNTTYEKKKRSEDLKFSDIN